MKNMKELKNSNKWRLRRGKGKNSVFWGLIGYKRGGRFGKCTKMIPFWTDFAFFKKIKDI